LCVRTELSRLAGGDVIGAEIDLAFEVRKMAVESVQADARDLKLTLDVLGQEMKIDMGRITSAAREFSCCLEINAEPDRLDLNDVHAHMAKIKGVKLAVSTDAHSVNAFQYIRFGIDQARRAWVTADDVINTRPLVGLRKLLKRQALQAA
jgi:histidinol phosphatase-like PHP family hydrolase